MTPREAAEYDRLRAENWRLQAALDRVIADAERLVAVVGQEFEGVSEQTLPRLRLVPEPTPSTTTQRGTK